MVRLGASTNHREKSEKTVVSYCEALMMFALSPGDSKSELPGWDSWVAALQQEHLQLLYVHQGPHSVQHQVRTPAAVMQMHLHSHLTI